MNITINTLQPKKLTAIYASDLHFELDKFCAGRLSLFSRKEADIFIIAGDLAIGTEGRAFIQHLVDLGYVVLYVLGNHEFYGLTINSTIQAWRDISAEIDNFYFLENDTVTINDVDFIGATLWTSLGTKTLQDDVDWSIKQKSKNWSDFFSIQDLTIDIWKHLFYQSKEYIFSQLNAFRKQVVITHYLPSELSSHDRFRGDITNNFFYTELGNEIAHSNALFWIHGHTHDSCNYFIYNTNILCNPRGYFNKNMINPDFSWDTCKIEIDL